MTGIYIFLWGVAGRQVEQMQGTVVGVIFVFKSQMTRTWKGLVPAYSGSGEEIKRTYMGFSHSSTTRQHLP